jgi:hypothetical protein
MWQSKGIVLHRRTHVSARDHTPFVRPDTCDLPMRYLSGRAATGMPAARSPRIWAISVWVTTSRRLRTGAFGALARDSAMSASALVHSLAFFTDRYDWTGTSPCSGPRSWSRPQARWTAKPASSSSLRPCVRDYAAPNVRPAAPSPAANERARLGVTHDHLAASMSAH